MLPYGQWSEDMVKIDNLRLEFVETNGQELVLSFIVLDSDTLRKIGELEKLFGKVLTIKLGDEV
jgi:hypothetical protein